MQSVRLNKFENVYITPSFFLQKHFLIAVLLKLIIDLFISVFINRNFEQIKKDIVDLVESEIYAISDDPSRSHLIVKKKKN